MTSSEPGPVEVAIRQRPQANGLAIIISNDYCVADGLDKLTGTLEDGKRMKDTFETIGFAAVHQQNVTLSLLQKLTYEATQVVRYPESYKSICFVFSGHGGCDTNEDGGIVLRYLYDQTGVKMEIANIWKPFMPKAAARIGNIPKVFFIDACRGDREMHLEAVMVPKSGGVQSSVDAVHQKGGTVKVHLEMPPEGNYLIAYATTENYQSYEVENEGGIWLRALSEMIREKAATESVMNILAEVNAVLKHKYQDPKYKRAMTQPEFNSKLDGILYLIPKVQSATTPPSRQRAQSSESTAGNSQETLPRTQPEDQYQTMLNGFARNYCINPPTYETVPYDSSEHKLRYFKSCVTIHLRNGITIKEDSRQYYISQQLSQEEAAKNACDVIQRKMEAPSQFSGTHPLNQQLPQVHNPACSVSATTQVFTQPHASASPLIQGQQSYNGPSCSASIPPPLPLQPVSGKGLPPSGSDRERLNYFFQTNKVNPQYDYVSDNTGGQPRYRCTIKYFMNGKTERVDSGGYYRSKGEAKEFAAKKVLIKETKGETFEVVYTTPQDKIWKSKLKEYYDKRGQPNAPVYKTFEVALGRFQSTVFTGDFGPGGMQGDVCDSKKEAEQSAAQKAVKMLNQSVFVQ